ncbi:MAG TPA: hypothetical protein VGP82_01235, partial [Ktedonobacterales bacterium]|nr:hypothetical protein [Ktedonobacterales bacterium]
QTRAPSFCLQGARLHATLADHRAAGLHPVTTHRLLRETRVNCVESLAVKHLWRTPPPLAPRGWLGRGGAAPGGVHGGVVLRTHAGPD